MRADMFLKAADALPFGEIGRLTEHRGLVVVAPHPDDESLGCGGLIAAACSQELPVRVVVVSDGCGSHPTSRRYPTEKLRALRAEETRQAITTLGLSAKDLIFLDLPDRSVPTDGTAADRAVEAIVAAAVDCSAGAIFVTWSHDPHCDHQASAMLAALAATKLPNVRLWSYPVWGWSLPAAQDVGPPPRGIRLWVAQYLAAKETAIAAHRSQTTALIDDDPEGFKLEPAMVQRFLRPFEIYLETPIARVVT